MTDSPFVDWWRVIWCDDCDTDAMPPPEKVVEEIFRLLDPDNVTAGKRNRPASNREPGGCDAKSKESVSPKTTPIATSEVGE